MTRKILWLALAALAVACNGSAGVDPGRDAGPDANAEVLDDATPDAGDTAAPDGDAGSDATPDVPADGSDADVGTHLLASATAVPEGAYQGPALVISLAGTDETARTVTVEVALEGPLDEVSGVAFDLAYDAAFLTPVDSAVLNPFSAGPEAQPEALGAFAAGRARFSYGAALLRSAPVTVADTYYEKGPFLLPSQSVLGRRVLATLTFAVTAGGSGQLVLGASDSVLKDRRFHPVPVSRVGLALVAN